VIEAERLGLAPLDYCPGSPAVSAIEDLAEHLATSSELTTTHQEVSS